MSYASKMFHSNDGSLLIQIAMFSMAGLSTTMAMAFVFGFQIAYPWF